MAASIPLHHFLTRKCNSNVLVHAILGIRPPAEKIGARLGLPGSHGPGR